MVISNAKIVDDSVHFVQTNYCRNSILHSFNGVACNFSVKLLDDDRLELGMTTMFLPFSKPEVLTRTE